MYDCVRRAFNAAGVPWEECDREDRGDSVFVLVPAEIPKSLFVDSVTSELLSALREHNSSHVTEEQIRLRMAVHAGEVAYDDHGVAAAAVNLTFRLLDAKPLKDALAESPGQLALITSDWFFDDVVRHSQRIDPATFRPVWITVKETSAVAWIALPDHPYAADHGHLVAQPRQPMAESAPHQLPAAPRSFTGRAEELATLTTELNRGARRGGPVVISAIAGAGGIGKTWFALYWAHRHADRFPDGHLFVNLHGFSPTWTPVTPTTAIRGFLDALGIAPARIPADLDAQAALYRSQVAGRRILIVLDNARDAGQVVPLLPGSPTCTVLITSRNQLPSLITGHGARHVRIDVLREPEARSLLTKRLGIERVTAEPGATEELLAYCGGFPLALSIVSGRAYTHPRAPLALFAAELRDASLGALDEDDPAASLPKVLSWSYSALTSEQARVFELLGIAPGPDISLPAVKSLTCLDHTQAIATLRSLEQVCLIDQDAQGRYRMHDLIRRSAAMHADKHQSIAERQKALRRVIDFYVHTADTGDRRLDPQRPRIFELDTPTPGCVPHPLPDSASAIAWFDAEHSCLLAAQQESAAHDWHKPVWQLAWNLATFAFWRGYLYDRLKWWQVVLSTADRLGDPVVQAMAHRHLGDAYTLMGRPGDGLDHLQQSLDLAQAADDQAGQAHAHQFLSWAWQGLNNERLALHHATNALQLYQSLNTPVWEATALNNVGWHAARLGQYDQARVNCESALARHRHHRYHDGEAHTLATLGYIAHNTGQHAESVNYYENARSLFHKVGNSYKEADTLDDMGHPHVALGQHTQARAVWIAALDLYRAHQRSTDANRVQQQLDAIKDSKT